MPVRPAIIPTLRYSDAPAAIDFLCRAFGFETKASYADQKDPSIVHHAELVLDGNMIMLATAMAGEHADAAGLKTVAEAGGATSAIYVVLDDVDGHAERARSAGADIFYEPRDQSYGGRSYSARDPEGNVWSFGSYDPWAY